RTRPLRTVGWRRCARQQPHENRGTPDGSVAAQTKSCLTDAQAGCPADQNGRAATCLELNVCQAIPSQARKSPSAACRCPALFAFFGPTLPINCVATL